MVIPGNGKLELIYTPEGGQEQRTTVFDFKNGGGCSMAMYNTDEVCNFINKYVCVLVKTFRYYTMQYFQM